MECVCPICNCKFSYENEDILEHSEYLQTTKQTFILDYFLYCPECNNTITIAYKNPTLNKPYNP